MNLNEQLFIINVEGGNIVLLADKRCLRKVMEGMDGFDHQMKFLCSTLGDTVITNLNETFEKEHVARLFFSNSPQGFEYSMYALDNLAPRDYGKIGHVYATDELEGSYFVANEYKGKKYCLFT